MLLLYSFYRWCHWISKIPQLIVFVRYCCWLTGWKNERVDGWVGGWWIIRIGSETWKELTPQVQQEMSDLKMRNIERRDRRQKYPLPSSDLPHIHQGTPVNAQKAPQYAHCDPDSEIPSQADQPGQGWWLRSGPTEARSKSEMGLWSCLSCISQREATCASVRW